MENNVSLFSSLSGAPKKNIYVADDYSLTVIGRGNVEFKHGHISNVYHVPRLCANLLLVVQLKNTRNFVECWSYCFNVKDLRLGG